jgi:serine/threonine protein kinase
LVAATPGGLLGASSLLAPALRTRVEPLSPSGPSGRLRCGHEARPKWLIPRLCHPQIRLPPRPHEARQTPLREGRTASFDALVLIDFGLARAFYTADGHISMRKHQGRAGTARYASMNTHRGLTQSRRDDLESIGYLLVFLHRGRLPWQGVRAASRKEKHLRICEAKARTSLPELCAAMPGMLEYLQYVRNLGFDADPDYEYLRRLFLQQGHTAPADWAGQEHLPPRAASAPRLDRAGGDNRPPPPHQESTDSAVRALAPMTPALEAVHETMTTSGEATAYEQPASAAAFLSAPQQRNSPRAVVSQHALPHVPAVSKRKRGLGGSES